MRRLDSAVARERSLRIATLDPGTRRTDEPREPREPSRTPRTLLPLAAMLALVTIGVLVAMRYNPAADTAVAVKTRVTER